MYKQCQLIIELAFLTHNHCSLPSPVRATGHKTPGESSEIRMRLLKGYSTLYSSRVEIELSSYIPFSSLCSLIPLYSLYILTRSWALGVKGTVLYNCGVELGVYD